MTKRKIAFMFAGQGSQYYQMGRELYESNPTFRMNMEHMDRLVQAQLGTSVIAVLYGPNGKAEPFTDIRFTHPAIFMVEFALARTLIALGVEPDCTLGASLGTFAALTVAHCCPMEEALAAVVRQALAIERHGPPGGMIAVLAKPALYEASPYLQARSVIGGRNFASHFVLSAPHEHLADIEGFLFQAEVPFLRIPAPYPFHGPWIDPLRAALLGASAGTRPRLSGIPVYCCAQGGALEAIPDDYLWQVARKEVAFSRVIAAMEASGPVDYVDCSPSGTLSTFLKYLLPKQADSRAFSAMVPFGRATEWIASVVEQLQPNGRGEQNMRGEIT